ncbi:MAG: 16S rRNA (adenine(1518)-N(6)/adenine(1519)-N(6))-dimethyltransferase RsmA [Bacteroidia bacterium]|nr:16S rRNA (adenine(1518)-N(6)/adenine(1519)-N(6))-dimethyltransferase RsmA [Bacteroidia bacterium]MCX7764789.1 16S rRNA (adenine(1518)-N(6)/adenine(1519)-N(6))-dimethyltransferase RsmA [Bacteroidia bacterium]MDW8058003.1 16S rRNA (adenine(1518)-N(6)/adenine(1519)-N(6))-dimethyltransferase RsmA [Bacteroidia bacterium]
MPRYDQHFLRTASFIQKIADAVRPKEDETIIEVGPGKGALTQLLLLKPVPYIGIEIDAQCLSHLRLLFPTEKAQWIEGDFLHIPLPQQPLYFVSNLPYSITGPALFRILEHRFWIREGVLMLQAEVAQRLYASAGKRPYGKLSVLFQSVYQVERLFRVPPGAFYPPPKVWSEVVRFTRQPRIALEEWESFAETVRAAFHQPRQMLRRNLRHMKCPPEWLSLRPHQLSVQDFIQLWRLNTEGKG